MMVDRNDRQIELAKWAALTFGERPTYDPKERALRVLEEAIELAQAEGIEERHCSKLVAHVYDKDPGDPRQEIGGVGICLLLYAHAKHVSADAAEADELKRIQSKSPEHFRARHALKVDAGVAMASEPPTESSAG